MHPPLIQRFFFLKKAIYKKYNVKFCVSGSVSRPTCNCCKRLLERSKKDPAPKVKWPQTSRSNCGAIRGLTFLLQLLVIVWMGGRVCGAVRGWGVGTPGTCGPSTAHFETLLALSHVIAPWECVC